MTALRDSHSSPTPNCAHQAYAVLPPSMPAPVPAPTNENGLAYDVTAGNLDRLRAFLVDARRAWGVEEAQLAEGVGTVAPSWLLANPAHSMRRNRADLVPRPTRTLRAGLLGRYSNRGETVTRRHHRLTRALERDGDQIVSPKWRPHRLEPRLGPDAIPETAQAYQGGASARDLARRDDVAESTIRTRLHEAGVPLTGPKHLTSEQLIQLVRLRRAGWSHSAIAAELGVTRQAVRGLSAERCFGPDTPTRSAGKAGHR